MVGLLFIEKIIESQLQQQQIMMVCLRDGWGLTYHGRSQKLCGIDNRCLQTWQHFPGQAKLYTRIDYTQTKGSSGRLSSHFEPLFEYPSSKALRSMVPTIGSLANMCILGECSVHEEIKVTYCFDVESEGWASRQNTDLQVHKVWSAWDHQKMCYTQWASHCHKILQHIFLLHLYTINSLCIGVQRSAGHTFNLEAVCGSMILLKSNTSWDRICPTLPRSITKALGVFLTSSPSWPLSRWECFFF